MTGRVFQIIQSFYPIHGTMSLSILNTGSGIVVLVLVALCCVLCANSDTVPAQSTLYYMRTPETESARSSSASQMSAVSRDSDT